VNAADDRLADALRAVHAAVYGYGVLGAYLEGAALAFAQQAEAAHRSRRDALLLRLSTGGATPPAAEPAYALPQPVTDQAGALRLAVTLEERTGAAWRRALGPTAADDRRLALEAFGDCAVRAVRARRLAGVSPVTVALPGEPAR
jgi:hypothetical protein